MQPAAGCASSYPSKGVLTAAPSQPSLPGCEEVTGLFLSRLWCGMKSARCHPVLAGSVAVFLAMMITACGGKSSMSDPSGSGGTASGNSVPASKHVVIVVEENQGYSTVAGNTSVWPHLNAIIGKGALATNYYADTHPSIGNYFMLTTGQIVTTDDNSTTPENVDSIARRLLSN